MFDMKERETVRRGLRVLVDEAPMAPDFEELTITRIQAAQPNGWSPLAILTTSGFLVAAALGLAFVLSSAQSEPQETPVLDENRETLDPPLPPLSSGEFPLVLVDKPGWTITYVQDSTGVIDPSDIEDTAIQGSVDEEGIPYRNAEIIFTGPVTEADLRLSSSSLDNVDRLVADRLESGSRLNDETALGSAAVVVRFEDSSTFAAIWTADTVEYEFVGRGFDGENGEENFRTILRAITRVNEDEWAASVSDEIVTDRASTVRQYLSDIPLPPGFDTTQVEEGPMEHWYQVGADTLSAVSCGWLNYWVNAKADGDESARQRAVEALGGSSQWGILTEMASNGGFHEMVREYADAIAADGTVPGGYETSEVLTVEESYESAFGCTTD